MANSPYGAPIVELEAKLESFFHREVRSRLGGMVVKLAPTTKGIPDRLVILPLGQMYLVELKTSKGKLSEMQMFVHSRIRSLGTEVVVLHGRGQILGWCHAKANQFDPEDKKQSKAQLAKKAATAKKISAKTKDYHARKRAEKIAAEANA